MFLRGKSRQRFTGFAPCRHCQVKDVDSFQRRVDFLGTGDLAGYILVFGTCLNEPCNGFRTFLPPVQQPDFSTPEYFRYLSHDSPQNGEQAEGAAAQKSYFHDDPFLFSGLPRVVPQFIRGATRNSVHGSPFPAIRS